MVFKDTRLYRESKVGRNNRLEVRFGGKDFMFVRCKYSKLRIKSLTKNFFSSFTSIRNSDST